VVSIATTTTNKSATSKFTVDQTITETSITTRTTVNDNVFIETEFPSRNPKILKSLAEVNIL
jgi:hypothetical protein